MKSADDPLLQFAVNVDQEVSAGNQIQPRKRRVFENAVLRKYNQVADFAPDAVFVAFLDKISPQTVLGQIRAQRIGITAFARRSERFCVEIGGKDLDLRPDIALGRFVEEYHRNG